MEHVLSNLNALNRSLENVISVGREFENVGDLWSKFYQDVRHDSQPQPPQDLQSSSPTPTPK